LHIVQRGHNREPCFFGEEDYLSYLYCLGEARKKESCAGFREPNKLGQLGESDIGAYLSFGGEQGLGIRAEELEAAPRP